MAFAREAPAHLVADAIESMVAELVDAVVGPFWVPLADDDQLQPPWRCTGCGSRQGFRRRGSRPRKVTTACGTVARYTDEWVQVGARCGAAREIVDGERLTRRAISRTQGAGHAGSRSSSRSESERYRPDSEPSPSGCAPATPPRLLQRDPSSASATPERAHVRIDDLAVAVAVESMAWAGAVSTVSLDSGAPPFTRFHRRLVRYQAGSHSCHSIAAAPNLIGDIVLFGAGLVMRGPVAPERCQQQEPPM